MEAIVDPTIKALSEPVFADLAEALSLSGYTLSFGKPIPGKGKKSFQKCREFKTAPVLSDVVSKNTKLLVVWWSKNSQGTIESLSVPTIILYKGILPGTWLRDVGLLSDSILTKAFPEELNKYLDENCQAWAEKYAKFIVAHNKSKRTQPSSRPKLPREFVFVPMQYTEDVSIKKYCSVPYHVFFEKVARFCIANSLPLVVKYHPDIVNNPKSMKWRNAEMKKVNGLIRRFQKAGCNIIASDGSIHWFCKNCTFMAGMNTAAHIDAIVNQCVSFHTGGSVFMNSRAVIHDDDIDCGLNRCLNITSEIREELQSYQRAMLYYMYNRYSVIKPGEDSHSSEWNNVQKIKYLVDSLGQV